ncbi:SGNH family hydrolase [Xanthobacter autotrophicus]|uniref:SGNH/GDSL hydrolase family protein n=1 Tax=Xanthobacter autotrophicus TaxID=280 RepID=UPI00372C7016
MCRQVQIASIDHPASRPAPWSRRRGTRTRADLSARHLSARHGSTRHGPLRAGLAVLVALVTLGLALAADAGRPALAQADFFSFLRPPGSVPQAAPKPQRPGQNSGWWPFQPQPRYEQPQQLPQQQPKRPTAPAEPEGVVYGSADAAVQGKRAAPNQFVLVIGDRLAAQLAQGLADAYAPDRARIAVIENATDDSGYLPAPVDWITRAPDAIAAARPSVTVIALGSEDLQPIKDGDALVQPLSERWMELYGKRVDEVLTAVRDKAGRVIVTGLAPVANTALSDDYAKLNELLRTRAARAGVAFAHVWDGFVDEDGKYLANGPAVDGQRRRLRFNDGVRFTRAGGRKLAFFVQKDINRMLAEPGKSPAAGDGTTPAISTRPAALAGPPVPARTPDPMAVSASANAAARVLKEGIAPAPVRGRADDFSWPPPGSEPAAAPAAAPAR